MAQIFNPGPSVGGNIGSALGTGLSGILEGLATKKAESVRAKRNYEGLIAEGVDPQSAQFMAYLDDKNLVKSVDDYRKNKQTSSDQAGIQAILSGQSPQQMPFNIQQQPGMQGQGQQQGANQQDLNQMLSGIQQATQQSPMQMLAQQEQFAPESQQPVQGIQQQAPESLGAEGEIARRNNMIQQIASAPNISASAKKNATDQLYKEIEQLQAERKFKFDEASPHMKGINEQLKGIEVMGAGADEVIDRAKEMYKLAEKGLNSPLTVAFVDAIKTGGPGGALGGAIGGLLGSGTGSVALPGIGTVPGAIKGAGIGSAVGTGLTRGLDLSGTILSKNTQKMKKLSASMQNFFTRLSGKMGGKGSMNKSIVEGIKAEIANVGQDPGALKHVSKSMIKDAMIAKEKWRFTTDAIRKEGGVSQDILDRADEFAAKKRPAVFKHLKVALTQIKKAVAEKRKVASDKRVRKDFPSSGRGR